MAQVFTPEEFTAPVQLLTVVPLSAKVIVPLGTTGVREVPTKVAVNVTLVFSAEGLAGEGGGEKLMVGCKAVIVYGSAAEVAVLKFESPE